ncbi:conserved hypothetical protein [Frankia sp. AiPs1]|uniref:hypothetical protein n=1 Tax=Frankia sp. AiPa1 TaxID=573492 RepID=UPI00202B5B74|nr:hypothetical protein [Frankia sp. AiPa1]MCL9758371.1 hypothetical protein [Frankia sp. AiPa1]
MTGLPRVAVLGLDAATAAAAISLVDGGLMVALFAPAPAAPDDIAPLAAYGCADRLTTLVPPSLRLSAAGPGAPPFHIHGTPAEGEARTPTQTTGTDTGAGADAEPLGTFEAVVLNADTEHLLPRTLTQASTRASTEADAQADSEPAGSARPPRFGGVFDSQAAWVFHVGGPPELAAAQGRWIGEYLRGRYALPLPTPHGRGRPRRAGVRGALAELDRELLAGHVRAATAGYPLPTPSAWPTTIAPTTEA